RFKLRDWPGVIHLLRNPEGAFQKIAATRAKESLAARGHLLLAEALLEQRDVRGAREILDWLSQQALPTKFDWPRHFLLCRTLLASGNPQAALATSSNLLAIAVL